MIQENVMKGLHLGCLLIALALLSACASTDTYLRSEYPFFISAKQSGEVVGTPYNLLTLYCVDANEKIDYSEDQNGKMIPNYKWTQCTYVSANTNSLFADPTLGLTTSASSTQLIERRDNVVSLLMSISDQNCDTFLNRAFANKATSNYTANVLRDLSTGGSAAFAYGTPGLSVALSAMNLFIGTTVGEYDKSFYVDQTFRAMRKAIDKKRARIKMAIKHEQKDADYTKFTMADALSRLREYASACSIQAGIAELEQLASAPTATQ